MKKILLSLIAALMSVSAFSAETVWHDATEFPLFGKISDQTNSRYERLPSYLEGVARKPVWNLGRNSAGLYLRFRSDSPFISVRWEPMFDNTMAHMADTGTKGLDLYMLTDNGWSFVRCWRLKEGQKQQEATISCDPVMREYMLYLSLYDGVKSLQIGVGEGSHISGPQMETPKNDKPVIMYGSSILQGGCCSRPGMAHTNILARKIDRTVINLGFSGNARIDYEIAELMASYLDPGVFVLDYSPNCTAELIDEKAEKFFRILRDAHPDVPIVFVALPPYPRQTFSTKQAGRMADINAAQLRVYQKLKKAGEKNIYYVKSEGMLGNDNEATVDGTHFTDLGMVRYVDHILPTIKKALRSAKVK